MRPHIWRGARGAAGGCPNLRLVDMRGCPRVGAASAAAFKRFIPLCELRVDDAGAAAKAVEGWRRSAARAG